NPSPSTFYFEDKPWIAVDNSSNTRTAGEVYVSWTRFTPNSDMIMLSRSTDHGKSWSRPTRVSPASQNGGVQGSQVAVGPAGEVYVTWEVFFGGNLRQHFMAKSTNGGKKFSAATPIDPVFLDLTFSSSYRTNSFPALAVSATNGNVYV